MTRSPVAILVVTYNSASEIAACVEAAKPSGAQVLVIDNGSSDSTTDVAKRCGATVIANRINRGFAAAVNQGVHATGAPFLLLLNPDAILQTGIDALVNDCLTPDVGAVGGALIHPGGAPQRGFNIREFPTPWTIFFETLLLNKLWPLNPLNWRYRCLGLDLTQRTEVDQPAGAFFLFRREAWQAIGGFDEGFHPIWFEDVDFCKRLRNAGFRVLFCPDSVCVHTGAHSIARLDAGTKIEYWYRSLLRYSIRHFSPAGRVLTCGGVVAGSFLRVLLSGFSPRSESTRKSYGTVIMLAFRSVWKRKVGFGEIL